MKECPACRRCFPDETSHCPDDGNVATPTLLGEPSLDGRYILERRLGQGGMGLVFKGRHIFLKTQHAIKIILPDLVGNDPMLATRFRQEALAAAAIRHQNVIAVTDFGLVRDAMPFLVMEFVKGRSLQEILAQEGRMSIDRVWEIISALGAGVNAAHRQNIVHRDLKPLNVMVQDDVPVAEGLKILDFGLAKIKSGELLGSFIQAQTSGLMGSPYYMAPEQWSEEEPDARADVYSLGVILYQMLCGEVPFKGSSIPSIMKKHLTIPPPSFHSFGVSVAPAIEAVVRHSLEKELNARIDSVTTFLSDLRAAMDSAPVIISLPPDTLESDPNRTLVSGLTMTDTQPPLPAASTQPPVPVDTQFSTSTPLSVPAPPPAPAPIDQQQEKLDPMVSQAKELEERLERLAVSVPPLTEDPEETRVSGKLPGTQDLTEVGLNSRPQLSQPMVIDLQPRSERKFGRALIIAAAVIVVLLGGAAVGAYFIFRPKPPIVETPPPPPPVELVSIDGGTFEMGRDNGPLQETPSHSVRVGSFYMDRTEVTNADYGKFVRETNYAPPSDWGGPTPPAGQELWPVVTVSFDDANAFAAWRSKRDKTIYRLPTEEEWEYAARNGPNGDLYPWGAGWKDKVAVINESRPAAVGSRPEGKNKWGVVDLIGNVWEWTSSRVSSYPGNPVVIPNDSKELVTIRGGGYASDPARTDSPISSCMREFVAPGTKKNQLGFRLVRSGT
ncbi:MAG TPA: bifunctional serine/threonine-protein kinase/formylglycine-generating enzyme family protein [Pyrinomonadaceae bacterium]